ncbi:acyl-CoA desaturase [Brevundimonas sp. NPDC046655]|uniref:acyl-CoA desaturase n=1 Tax=unclassified Brevundimonas TaxID=2622653 RepID=UPI0038501983
MDEHDPCAVNSLIETPHSSPVSGRVVWDPVHSLWNSVMLATTLSLGAATFSLGALAVLVVTTGATLLLGHSVGFHRRLIHASFDCPLWLERTLVWFGTVVGMSGPFWMIRTHDLRDWAQRQNDCHDYLAHRRPMAVDAVWQMHGRLVLDHPPTFDLGRIGRDPFYRFLERTWMLQQAPVAAVLWLMGGWGFVVWGVCARVSISVIGHWFVGHLAHRRGLQTWLVREAGGPGPRRALCRHPHHGRGLAQQPPRLARLGADRPLSRTERLGLPLHPASGTAGPGLERTDAGEHEQKGDGTNAG